MRSPVRRNRYRRTACAVATTLLLSACANTALERAPRSPDTPWQAGNRAPLATANDTVKPANTTPGFSIPAVAALGKLPTDIDIDPNKAYSLPELIDIAQRGHPDTRLAWNRARQAALSAGMVEATFLPMLSANVVGGYQRARYPLPENITGIRDINTELNGVVPALALGWLIFDFGQRKALYDAASELSFAQNVLFNAAHQKVIRDVTDQFYQYSMARTRRTLSASMLINQQKVLTERTIDPRGVRGTRRGQHPVQALAPSLWI
ncbi:MAG: TolC family protein [Pusillimonas sp.]